MKALCLAAAATLAAFAPPAASAGTFWVTFDPCATATSPTASLGPGNTSSCFPTCWDTVMNGSSITFIGYPDDNNGTPLSHANTFNGKIYRPRMVSQCGWVTDIYPGVYSWDAGAGQWRFDYDYANFHTDPGLITAPN